MDDAIEISAQGQCWGPEHFLLCSESFLGGFFKQCVEVGCHYPQVIRVPVQGGEVVMKATRFWVVLSEENRCPCMDLLTLVG